jgi:serine/threonine protein kinase
MSIGSLCPEPSELKQFALGRASAGATQAIQHHLEECSACLARLEKLPQNHSATRVMGRPGATPHKARAAAGQTEGPGRAGSSLSAAPVASGEAEAGARDASLAFLRPPARPDEIGRLGDYRVLRLIGRGGMGMVFHAEDIALCRPVALKVLKTELGDDCKPGQRFVREARMLAAIKHEHVVTVFRAGLDGETVYLAMELLEGQSLADLLDSPRELPTPEIVQLALEITSGLAAIHRHGLIHRDLKPSNIWLESAGRESDGLGRVKILDLGLARPIQQDEDDLTQSGVILGTPSFMSPEQARGDALDATSDLFSLGCVLYTLCTRAEPFGGETTIARLAALFANTPRPVAELNPGIPPDLADLVMQLLAKDPGQRPGSAQEVIDRLQQVGQPAANPKPTAVLPVPTRRVSKSGRRRKRPRVSRAFRWWIPAACLAGLLLLGTALAVALSHGRSGRAAAGGTEPQTPVYLSDRTPVAVVDCPPAGPPGMPPPPNPFTVISVHGIRSPHGIGMHASPRGTASLSYSLHRQYQQFSAKVGLNDSSPGNPLPLRFAVYGDGRLLWQSTPVSSQKDAQTCTVSVADVEVLKLAVTNQAVAPDGVHGAHAIWIEPSLAR